MKNIIKKELPIIAISFICALLLTFIMLKGVKAYSDKIVNNISQEVFRLHVVANSNSEADQALKLKIRDAILNEMNPELSKSKSKEETQFILCNNIPRIKKCALETIKKEGFDYSIKTNIGNEYFPEKHYGDICLPAGNYDSLKISVGKGEGKNWWCVMYPPLCFVDGGCIIKEADKSTLKENLSADDYRLITESNSVPIKIKFKIIEMFQ